MRHVLAELAAGRPVVVVHGEEGEKLGDLVLPAQLATPELMAFTIRHSSGFISVGLERARCEELGLAPIWPDDTDRSNVDYRVTVDAVDGISTGISAHDRARTARLLAQPTTARSALARPGHVVPVAACSGGVLRRRGRAEAAVDLMRLAGLQPAAVLGELVSERRPVEMATGRELWTFADSHGLAVLPIDRLVEHRLCTENALRRYTSRTMPTSTGTLSVVGYRDAYDGAEHLALVQGRVEEAVDVPVHIHVECLYGNVLGSMFCTCRSELNASLTDIAARRLGVVVYLRPAQPAEPQCPPPDSHRLPTLVAEVLRDLDAESWNTE
ncbi:3,4-dihydroxy-2-butanone-4-phosphate synthase [Sciscionella marina]|uniref:3,4-dihydroxy-2-butanone-4-phosphate synthase n=1 Tax=Sciscionella marina TaxID=508770 RepID=UPI0023E1DEBB|nr:3,4-dihydroxy-2-butanone-4-phosphate synthase [Sciscionella marina]